MLMRLVLYIINTTPTYLPYSVQRRLTPFGTAFVCVMILSLSYIFPHGVYKKWPLNMLEFSFFLNQCTLDHIHEDYYYHAIVQTSVCIAMLTFI